MPSSSFSSSSFISVTGFTDPSQVKIMRTELKSTKWPRRSLGVGVMMSYNTLMDLPTPWAEVYPDKRRVSRIFLNSPYVFNVLHYADYDGNTSLVHLLRAVKYGGANLDALQLDMPWPDIAMLKLVQKFHPDLRFIIQVSERAMRECGDDPARVAEKVAEYHLERCAHYILLDRSMGTGKTIEPHVLLPYLREITARSKGINVVVAGGLGPETTHLVLPFLKEYPNLSTDAQSRVCRGQDAHNPVDWQTAIWYLRKMCQTLRKK